VLRQKIEEMQSADQTQFGLDRENNAEYRTRLAEILETLSSLQSQLEEVTRRSAVRREPPPPPQPVVADTTSAGQVPAGPPPGERPDPNRLYETAYLDVNQRKYSLAIEGFRTYLQYYPDTELSDNAQYWIGESYFALEDYSAAASALQGLVAQYPKGDKVPSALLKLGESYEKLGDAAQARAAFEKLTKDFSKTEEARLARERLATMTEGNR
jgi:tol-pal system protein YbgF